MSDQPHLLLVDDDARIRSLLLRYLSEQGYRVTQAENGLVAQELLGLFTFDLLILDVMMPQLNGFDLAKMIRNGQTACASETPFLMLTARGESESRIQGLELGADDYLTKPFEPRELLLRIASILKRTTKTPAPLLETVYFGDFSLTLATGDLYEKGESVKLTDREKEMLKILGATPSQCVPRFELASLGAEDVNDRTVDVQITRLRRKLKDNPANPAFLQTVRGVGYRLIATP
jgi:two-component system, OmpR family, phosphate regulon response regulator OmpR